MKFCIKKINAVDGSESTSRKIKKPVSGTVQIAVNRIPQASGWSVETTTGIVTFTSAPRSDAPDFKRIARGCRPVALVRYLVALIRKFRA